jgi:ankyrin repeat protein
MNVRTVAIAQRLLAAGAEPGRRDRYGHDALDHAIIHGSDEVIALLTPADGEVRLEARLIRAVIQRDAAKVSELLSLGGHADAVDAFGQPALHLAAAACCPDIMRPLLDHGAAVDGRDAAGCTAIHGCLWSFEAHREDLDASLTLLLDRGASVLAVDRPGADGEAAIFKGHFWWRLPVVASRLLQACRDQRSRNGATALMAAVEYGTARQVADLLRERLDPRTVDNRGRTALHYAAAGGFNQYVDMEYAKKARLLVDGGATVDVTTATGETPLMAAVAAANDEMIELLLQEGANAEARNAAGQSLQQIALQARNVGLVNRFSQRASPSDGSAPMPLAES